MTRPGMTLTAAHLAGNAMLLLLGYYWLGIGESKTLTLLWSAFVALVVVMLACALHGTAFAYFSHDGADLRAASRTALRHLLALIAAVVVIAVAYNLVSRLAASSGDTAFKIASWLTLKLRKPVKPASVLGVFGWVFWFVRWVMLPVLLLPVVAGAAARGWSGFARFGRMAGRPMYWIETAALLLCAFWAPFKILGWVPHVGSFAMEIVSFALRLLIAYLLFVGSWLLLAFLTSAGKPVASQTKTVVSP